MSNQLVMMPPKLARSAYKNDIACGPSMAISGFGYMPRLFASRLRDMAFIRQVLHMSGIVIMMECDLSNVRRSSFGSPLPHEAPIPLLTEDLDSCPTPSQ